MKTLTELRQERGALVDQMKLLVAKTAGRAMTDDEQREWNSLNGQPGVLGESIAALDPDHAQRRVYVSDRDDLGRVDNELRQPLPTVAGRRQEAPSGPQGEVAVALAPTQSLREHVPLRPPDGIRPGDLSFGRALRAIITGDSRDAQAEQRVMATSPGASGGYLVPEAIALDVLDRARAASTVFRAGARTIPMDTQELHFARVVSAGPPLWKPENVAAPATDVVLDRVSAKARTQMIWVKMSEELARDSSPSAPPVIEQVFGEELANGLDLAALRGDPSAAGQDQPRGIKFTPGIIAMPAGGALTYDTISEAYEGILAATGRRRACR
jgi:HK97 family phage major capsid protein